MIEIIATPGAVISLGRQGENNARRVVFRLSRFRSLYGDGSAQLLVCRPGETEPYPAALTVINDDAIWLLSDADTAIAGSGGKVELRWYTGDALAKSEIWQTIVKSSIGEPRDNPPAPYESWMEDMLQVAADADISEAEAKKAAEDAKAQAESASESASNASGYMSTAFTYAENAEQHSQSAHTSANLAEARAEEADTSAKTAQDMANDAAKSASNAQENAAAAAESAKKAKEVEERLNQIYVDGETLII